MHGTFETGQRVEPSHMDHPAAGECARTKYPSATGPIVYFGIDGCADIGLRHAYERCPISDVRTFLTVYFHRPARSEKNQPFILFP